MPIYEYVCEACGRLIEVMQRLNDPPPASCPECGGDRMARMVSRTSFQLKGGGWYSDLYSSPKEKPKPGTAPAAPAAAEAKPAAASDATAAAAKPPAPAAGGSKPVASDSGGGGGTT